jgi:hypothetical protein
VVADLAGALAPDCPNLARLLPAPTPTGLPLLADALCYFLDREVKADQALARALSGQGPKQSAPPPGKADLAELARKLLEVLLQPGARLTDPGRTFDPATEARKANQQLADFRALPEAEKQKGLVRLADLARALFAAFAFADAYGAFKDLAGRLSDGDARARAWEWAYRSALGARRGEDALAALREAVRLDAGLAPFPFEKYLPQRVLAAGAGGAVFLCREAASGLAVAVKAVEASEAPEQGASGDVCRRPNCGCSRRHELGPEDALANNIVRLARASHPALPRPRDGGLRGPDRTRYFFVWEHFEGQSLEEHVGQHGALGVDDLLELACLVGGGLRAAHGVGLLHQHLAPASLLVRKDEKAWQARLIDFELLGQGSPWPVSECGFVESLTVRGSAWAEARYAAPEMRRRLAAPVGPHSDVYSFGKVCCFALFRTPEPTGAQWREAPAPLTELLSACTAAAPADRPADLGAVLERLVRLRSARKSAGPALVERFDCPQCGAGLRPKQPASVGQKVRCPKCGTVFGVAAK